GGTSTTSAKFAFVNNAGGTPVASVSAQNGLGEAISLSATGSLETSRMNTLTVGGSSTGNIIIDSGSNFIQLSDATINLSALTSSRALFLDTSSNVTTSAPSSSLATSLTDETGTGSAVFNYNPTFLTSVQTTSTSLDVFNTSATTVNAFGSATALTLGANSGTLSLRNPTINVGGGSATTIQTVSDDSLTLTPQGTGNLVLSSYSDTAVLIGNASNTIAPLSISGGIGSNA